MKEILRILPNHLQAKNKWKEDLGQFIKHPAIKKGDIRSHKVHLTIDYRDTRYHYKSAKSIQKKFYMGRYFDNIVGLWHVSNNKTKEEINGRLIMTKPKKRKMTMKNKILLTSAGFVITATVSSVLTALLFTDPAFAIRMTGVNTTLIVGSIGLFFVGLAFPKEV